MSGQRAIQRADRIVELVARSGEPLSLSDIAARIDAPVSSTLDLLDDLVTCGYLARADRSYRLGPRLLTLHLIGARVARPPLDSDDLAALGEHIGAPVALAVLVGSDVVYLNSSGEVPAHAAGVVAEYRPRPLLRTAAGQACVAFADESVRDRLLAAHTTPSEAARFVRGITEIRRRGFAVSDGLADPEIYAVGIPVFGDGLLSGVVVVVGARAAGRHSRATDRAARQARDWLGGTQNSRSARRSGGSSRSSNRRLRSSPPPKPTS